MNKKITINKIDTFSVVRLSFFIGLVVCFFALLILLSGLHTIEFASPLAVFGTGLVKVFLLELYIVVFTALYCWFYNLMATKFGGIQLEISDNSPLLEEPLDAAPKSGL